MVCNFNERGIKRLHFGHKVFTLNTVVCFKFNQFLLNLLCVNLHIVEDSLVYGETLVYLRQILTKIFVLVVNFVFEKSSVSVERCQLFVDYIKYLQL